MAEAPKLSVVIVSFNTSGLTVQCVDSVLKTTKAEIIVVDNHSSDDSVSVLKKKFGSRLTVIENKENVGFARANNQGVQKSSGKYVLLLNSDTIVSAGALDKLMQALEFNWNLGAVAASLLNPDGSYQAQGGALPTLSNLAAWWLWPFPGNLPGTVSYQDTTEPKSHTLSKRGWVGGTAVMFRRAEYLDLGGLDEAIFMYAEDIDLCLRLASAKLSVAICADAKVTHFGSASGSFQKARLGEVRGLLYIFKKYKTPFQHLCMRGIFLAGSLLRYLLFGILRGDASARELYAAVLAVSLG